MSVYFFRDYRLFLEDRLSPRGHKKLAAEAVGCQTTFLSNVLRGDANLSLEHAFKIAEFLALSEKEAHYFMLLVQVSKAGSADLKKYFTDQLTHLQNAANEVSSKIAEHQAIKPENQVRFYNSWIYVAIHILVAVEKFQSRIALQKYFRFSAGELEVYLKFMIENGILTEINGFLKQGSTRTHLPKESPFLIKHHSNWRIKAIDSLDRDSPEDLHYTLVMSLSKEDVAKVKQILLESIKKTDQVLQRTGDETVYCFSLDWFRVG